MFIISLPLKAIILLLCLISIINKTKLYKGEFHYDIFLFFTNLSVFLSLVFYGADIYNYALFKEENSLLLNLKGAVVLYTFVTMMVYNLILVPKHRNTGISHDFYSLQDTTIHCIIPLLVLFEWLITHKREIDVISPIIWLSVPLLYFIIVEIKGKLKLGSKFDYADSYYPYFFLDVDQIGIKKVIINLFILLFIFWGLGYLIFAIDHLVFIIL